MMWETHLIIIHVVMVLTLVVVTIVHVHLRVVVWALWSLSHEVLIQVWSESLRDTASLEVLRLSLWTEFILCFVDLLFDQVQ